MFKREKITILESAINRFTSAEGAIKPGLKLSIYYLLKNVAIIPKGTHLVAEEYEKAKEAWLKTLNILKLNYGEHPYIDIVNRSLKMVEKEL